MLLGVSFYGVEHVDVSGMASVCTEDIVANFKEVSQHLYYMTEQDNGRSLSGKSDCHARNFQNSS